VQAYPRIWPFNQVFTDYYEKIARPLPFPATANAGALPSNLKEHLKIDAIFIFNDPRDWGLDSQIILDLLLSKEGYLGTYSEKNGNTSLPNDGWQQDGQPPLIFSNPDLFWAAGYHLNRLGQGGFRAGLEGIWKETTGGAELAKTVIGKPYHLTYMYAERVLRKYRAGLLGKGSVGKELPTLNRVFMVGDNPESDIRGANDFKSPNGTEWTSILVKSGVFRTGTKPKYEPKIIVDGVLDAVRWALDAEGWDRGKWPPQ
jgi:HAD superfamily hydrolase (TIGR01456 family)